MMWHQLCKEHARRRVPGVEFSGAVGGLSALAGMIV